MTTWDPYPSASNGTTTTGVTYEPYPTTQTPGYQAPGTMVPYQAYRDPIRIGPGRPSVAPVPAVKLALKNWNNYSGRASRSEFWWPMLGMVLVNLTVGNGAEAAFRAMAHASGVGALGLGALGLVLSLAWLAAFVPMLSLGVRRLHDTGKSGWHVLLALIPFVGYLITAFFMARPSDPSGARYDNPRTAPFDPEDL